MGWQVQGGIPGAAVACATALRHAPQRTYGWRNGDAPDDPNDPEWATFDEWLAEGRRLDVEVAAMATADEELETFRMAGEWENPEPETLIPYRQACDALAQFLVTGMRPTNVAWEDL